MGEALACLLESRRGWTATFVASSATEAIAAVHNGAANVLLVDTLGLEADEVEELIAVREAGEAAVVLLIDETTPGAYLDLPVDRVISRCASSDVLFAALDELARPSGRLRANALPFDLSRRELECAQLVARGLSNRRIAELTGLREQSVKNVVSLAMRKLGVENRVQIALRLGQTDVADAVPMQAVVSISIPTSTEEPETLDSIEEEALAPIEESEAVAAP